MSDAPHNMRFPGESDAYRTARNELLTAETALRAQVEAVAALRRQLPAGGAVAEDYSFVERADGGAVAEARLSALFGDHDNLMVYSFMYGPDDKAPCPMCSSFLDSLNGAAPHIKQRVSLAVVAKSPIDRIHAFADGRGWANLRLLSSANNSYNTDYFGETPEGSQIPACNIFVRRDGQVRHAYATELLFAPGDSQPRHMDLMWPLWGVLDLTPGGRGSDWYPALSYE